MNKAIVTALAVVLLAGSSLAAQEASAPPMREEVVKLNYVRINDILPIISAMRSREGIISPSPNQPFLIIRDHPENVEKMLAVIRKLDVKPADLVFTVRLILASAADDVRGDESLAGDPVIKELRSLLRYKSFALLDTSLVRAVDRQRSRVTMGTKETEFVLELDPVCVREETGDLMRVGVELAQRIGFIKAEGVGDRLYQKTLIESNLSLKSGESAVVGVSKMDGGDKGLILIISGKVVN